MPTSKCYARPRVAILSTGNEVVEPGRISRRARSSTSTASRSAPSSPRTAASPSRTRRRTIRSTRSAAALDACAGADVDRVFRRQLGRRTRPGRGLRSAERGEMIFHGIAVRPGKPTAFAPSVDGRLFSACRAIRRRACRTPTSCSCRSCGALARLPLLAPRTDPRAARPAHRVRRPDVTSSTRSVCTDGVAWPAFKGSGEITSLSQADGYIEIPADQSTVEEGALVDVILF